MYDILVVNETRPLPTELRARYCSSFLCRFKGLMFRRSIPSDWGLLLVQASDSIVNSAIHMVAVPFDLGVIWINDALEVVDVARVKKWIGIKSPQKAARYILEIVPERVNEFEIGDRVSFVEK
jgi:uncharacterized membrane protein (UPF0127 family)